MRCLNPIVIIPRDKREQSTGIVGYEVPCGHCAVCRKERKKEWGLRLLLESLSWHSSLFVTLTLDGDNLNFAMSGKGIEPTLVKEDLVNFFKKLRKAIYPRKIKYYAVGEYGDRFNRPHYHAIIFGADYTDRLAIEQAWNKGHVDIGECELASCNYVSGYVQKKLYGELGQDVYGNLERPFSLMSKGLGKAYCLSHKEELLTKGLCLKGQHYRIPRAFYKWITAQSLEDGVSVLNKKYELGKKAELEIHRKKLQQGKNPLLPDKTEYYETMSSYFARKEELGL